ncbi:MAG: hypothetical protein K2Q45_05275 [Nitrosomonas sp.]|nr:hypothetical protein [Nitrosomonas sp.]
MFFTEKKTKMRRWHRDNTVPVVVGAVKKEPTAYEKLLQNVDNVTPFWQIADTQWKSLFSQFVHLITRMCLPGAETPLERFYLKQDHDQMYPADGDARHASSYWHMAKLMTASEIKDIIQTALNTHSDLVHQDLLPPERAESDDHVQNTLDMQYYTHWYQGIPRPLVYACCGQPIGKKGCWIALDPTQEEGVIVPYSLMPVATAHKLWDELSQDKILDVPAFLRGNTTLVQGTAFFDYAKFAALDVEVQKTWSEQAIPLFAEAIRLYVQAMDATFQQDPVGLFPVNASRVLKENSPLQLNDLWPKLKHIYALIYQFNAPQHEKHCKQMFPVLESDWNELFNRELFHVDVAKLHFNVETRGFVVISGKQIKFLRNWQRDTVIEFAKQLDDFKKFGKDIQSYSQLWNLNKDHIDNMFNANVQDSAYEDMFKRLPSESFIVSFVNSELRKKNVKIDIAANVEKAKELSEYYVKNLEARVDLAFELENAGTDVDYGSVASNLDQSLKKAQKTLNLMTEKLDRIEDFKKDQNQRLRVFKETQQDILQNYRRYLWLNQNKATTLSASVKKIVLDNVNSYNDAIEELRLQSRTLVQEIGRTFKLYGEIMEEQQRQKEIERKEKEAEEQRKIEEERKKKIAEEKQRKQFEAEKLRVEEERAQKLLEVRRKAEEEVAKKQKWLDVEKNAGDLVANMTAFLLADTFDKAQESLEVLFNVIDDKLLPPKLGERDDVQLLAWALNMITAQEKKIVVSISWENDVWDNRERRAAFQQAIVKFIRYLLVQEKYSEKDFLEIWTNVITAKLQRQELPGYKKTTVAAPAAALENVNVPEVSDYNITTSNFEWNSAGGGSCAFDALMTGLFKVPGTWFEQYILENANQAIPLVPGCNVNELHRAIVQDIAFLKADTPERPDCQTRPAYYRCVKKAAEWDDSRELTAMLLRFYNAEDNMQVIAGENYDANVEVGKEMVMFEVGPVVGNLMSERRPQYNPPVEISNNEFVLMTCFIFKGGNHWLSYVRDPLTEYWWKFDAIADVNDQIGPELPRGVAGLIVGEQPGAFLYVRKSSLLKNKREREAARAKEQKEASDERARIARQKEKEKEEAARAKEQKEKEAADERARVAREKEEEAAAARAAEEKEKSGLSDLIVALKSNVSDDEILKILSKPENWNDGECDLLAQGFQIAGMLSIEEYYRYLAHLFANGDNSDRLNTLLQTVTDQRVLTSLNEIAESVE